MWGLASFSTWLFDSIDIINAITRKCAAAISIYTCLDSRSSIQKMGHMSPLSMLRWPQIMPINAQQHHVECDEKVTWEHLQETLHHTEQPKTGPRPTWLEWDKLEVPHKYRSLATKTIWRD